MLTSARVRFLEKLRSALEDASFVKLTLSKSRDRDAELRNVYARIIEVKAGSVVSFTLRYGNRDVTRNHPFNEVPAQVGSFLADVFEEAHLFTTSGDWRLRAGAGGEGALKASRPTFAATLSTAHDRQKPRALANAEFLCKLGVTLPDGTARAGMADKLRQVERFVEILGHLVDDSPLREATEVSVCDMGAGKGYLTFATHDFFRRRGANAAVVGVEQRAELVEHTNRIAQELSCEGLRFERGAIGDFATPERLEVLIALHACDTATDDALAAGVKAGAALLVVSPCCQKEVRRQLVAPPVLADLLRHGILAERQAELVTDGLRAMVLEACGYEAKVFEFISNEHTGKNVMIAAIRRSDPKPEKWAAIRETMAFFGLREQRLVELLQS